jgi:choline transport protein
MEKNIDLQTFDDDHLGARRKGSISEAKGAQDFDRDRYELARVGKEQVLKVCGAS